MSSEEKRNICIFAAIIIVLVLIIGAAMMLEDNYIKNAKADDASKSANGYLEEQNSIYIGGERYLRKSGMRTLLLIGIDEEGIPRSTESYDNSAQSDFNLLVIFDDTERTYTILQLNRDTMTEIDVIGFTGIKTGSVHAQLALAHTYGDGLESSCENTVAAVSNLLFGIDIENYISMTMDVVSRMNDLVGGVTLTLSEDLTAIDPAMAQGNTVTLSGEMALKFVRARGRLDDSTNIARMNRQKQYLESFMDALSEKSGDQSFVMEAYEATSDYLVTNCTVNTISKLFESFSEYTSAGIISPEGEAVIGREYMEFYADDAKLRDLVIGLFYVKQDD